MKFDGSRSYDSDPAFIGKSSVDSNSEDWNGITRWIWDFGDATPQVEGAVVWHQYSIPGTYIVTLTVVDGFEEVRLTQHKSLFLFPKLLKS